MDNITAVLLDKALALRPKPGLKINGKDMFNPKTILHNLKFDTIKDKELLYGVNSPYAYDITPLFIINFLKRVSPRKLTVIYDYGGTGDEDYSIFQLIGEYYKNYYTYDVGKYDVVSEQNGTSVLYIFTQKVNEPFNSGLDIEICINEAFMEAIYNLCNAAFPTGADYVPITTTYDLDDVIESAFYGVNFVDVTHSFPGDSAIAFTKTVVRLIALSCVYETLRFTSTTCTERFMLERIIDETFTLIAGDIDEDALTFTKEEILDILSMTDENYLESDYYTSEATKNSRNSAINNIFKEIFNHVLLLTNEYGNYLGDGHYDNHNHIGLEKYLLRVLNEHFVVDDERTYENDYSLPVSFEFYRHGIYNYLDDTPAFTGNNVFMSYIKDSLVSGFNDTYELSFEEFINHDSDDFNNAPLRYSIIIQDFIYDLLERSGVVEESPLGDVVTAKEYRVYEKTTEHHKVHISREYLTVLYRSLMHSVLGLSHSAIDDESIIDDTFADRLDNELFIVNDGGNKYMISLRETVGEMIDVRRNVYLYNNVGEDYLASMYTLVEPSSFETFVRFLLWNSDRLLYTSFENQICCNTAKFLSNDERYFYTCYTPRILNNDVKHPLSPWFEDFYIPAISMVGKEYEQLYGYADYLNAPLEMAFSIADSLSSNKKVYSTRDPLIVSDYEKFVRVNKEWANYYYTDVCYICSDKFNPEVDDYDEYIQKSVYELYDMPHNSYDDLLVHLYKHHSFDYPFKPEDLVVTSWKLADIDDYDWWFGYEGSDAVAMLYSAVLDACGFVYHLTSYCGDGYTILQSNMIKYSNKFDDISDFIDVDNSDIELDTNEDRLEIVSYYTVCDLTSTNYYLSYYNTGVDDAYLVTPELSGVYMPIDPCDFGIKYKVDIMSEVEYYAECLMGDYKNKYPRIERELPGIHYGVKGINWII